MSQDCAELLDSFSTFSDFLFTMRTISCGRTSYAMHAFLFLLIYIVGRSRKKSQYYDCCNDVGHFDHLEVDDGVHGGIVSDGPASSLNRRKTDYVRY
jgi:hypothetical protein